MGSSSCRRRWLMPRTLLYSLGEENPVQPFACAGLPLIVEGKRQDAAGPAFHQRAARGGASDLADGGVQIDHPMSGDELGGAEADPRCAGARVGDFVDRVT